MTDFNFIDIHYSNAEGIHSKWQRVTIPQVPKIVLSRTDPVKYANWFCTLQHFAEPEHKDNEIELCPLAFDFDCAADVQHALDDTLSLVEHLIAVFDVDISSEFLMIYYSGNRGFHVTINHEILEVEPMVDLIKVYRLMAENLHKTLNLSTLDRTVYTRRRAWRVPNTKHGKTGLYKRALTLLELNSGIDNIKALAKSPCDWLSVMEVI
jgi:hypothetical protein